MIYPHVIGQMVGRMNTNTAVEGLQTVIRPLANLKEAVDHAATGNFEIEFELHGGGEVVEIAKSIENLASLLRRQPYDQEELEA